MGTMAEAMIMVIAAHHEVVYAHKAHPSREWLEERVDSLEHQLHKSKQYVQQLQDKLEEKDYEIHRLQKKIKILEQRNHAGDHTEIVFSTKSIS